MDSYYYDAESNIEYVKKNLSICYNNIIFFIALIFFLICPFTFAYIGLFPFIFLNFLVNNAPYIPQLQN